MKKGVDARPTSNKRRKKKKTKREKERTKIASSSYPICESEEGHNCLLTKTELS